MKFQTKPSFLILICLIFFGNAQIIFASTLVNIPGYSATMGMEEYLNALYAISISIAALLAVIKIIIAGVKYMLSDVVTSKSAAIKDIQGALLGIIIIVMAWVILYVINPDILNSELNFDDIREIDIAAPITPTSIEQHRRTIEAASGTVARRGPDGRNQAEFEADCTGPHVQGMIDSGNNCIFDLNSCNQSLSRLCCDQTYIRSGDRAYNETFSYCMVPATGRRYRELSCSTCAAWDPDPALGCATYDCSNARNRCTSGSEGNILGLGAVAPGTVVATTTGSVLCRIDT